MPALLPLNLTPVINEMKQIKNLFDNFMEIHEHNPTVSGSYLQYERTSSAVHDLTVVKGSIDILLLRLQQSIEFFSLLENTLKEEKDKSE